MKVAFTNSIFFRQKYGGVSRYFCSVMNELINANIDIKVFTLIFKNNYLKKIPKKNRQGIFIPRYPIANFLENQIEKVLHYQIQNSSYDIVHETYYSREFLNFNRKKKVITVYDLIHEKFDNLYTKKNLSLKKRIIDESDVVICISNNTKNDLINYYKVPEKKIYVTYLGCDHLKDDPENGEFEDFFLPENFILFVGSRLKYKNFKLFIESYASSKIIRDEFEIVCFGGGNFTDAEKKFFSELNLDKKIIHRHGNDNLLSYLYKKAKLFIFPSQYEGFGIPLIEAMSLGCPVLASDINVFREISENGINYFTNNDKKSLTENLEYLLKNEKNLNSKITFAKKISNKYSWKKCANQTIEIYNKI